MSWSEIYTAHFLNLNLIRLMDKELFEKSPILKLAFDCSFNRMDGNELLESPKKRVNSRQRPEAGTSNGANAGEAQNGENKIDFLANRKVTAKDADGSQYRLWQCQGVAFFPDCPQLQLNSDEIHIMVGKILLLQKASYRQPTETGKRMERDLHFQIFKLKYFV